MDLQRLASTLLGKKRAETNTVMTDATTRTYIGTATSTSEDGSVYVELSEDVTLPDDDDGTHGLGVEMPTTVAVDEGDEVLVTVFGGGVMKAPVVTGNPGWGDRVQTQVDSAETLAEQAEAVATATGQHFWDDDNGAHVTEITRDEWEEAPSGPDVLINSRGQLFRIDENNLLALLPGNEVTDTFVIVDDPDIPLPSYTLSAVPTMFPTIKVGGEVKSPSLFHLMNENVLVVDGDTPYWLWDGQTMEVTYRTSPAMVLYDGEGNASGNVIASFESGKVSLAKKFNPDAGASGKIEFFNGEANLSVSHLGGPTITLEAADLQPPETSASGIRMTNGYLSIYANSSEDDSGVDYGFGQASINLWSGQYIDAIEMSAETLQLRPGEGAVGEDFTMQNVITELFHGSGVGTFSSPFGNYDNNAANAPHWYRSGNVVSFHGIAKPTSQIAADRTSTLFTLPVGYRPKNGTRYIGRMQGSGLNSWILTVTTAGAVNLARYGTTSDIAIPTTAWLPFSGTFIIG